MFKLLSRPTLIALTATTGLVLSAAARDAGWAPLHDLRLVSWLVIAFGYAAAMALAGRQAEVEFDRERLVRRPQG